MSDRAFVERMAKKRQEHLNALLLLPDGDALKHSRTRGHIAGLDEAMQIFRDENKSEDKDGD